MTTKRPSRRSQILTAAAELFVKRGFHGTSIDALGEAVGTSGPALYRHFPSKVAILSEMLLATAAELAATALNDFPRGGITAEEELHDFVRRQSMLSYERRYELALLDREIANVGSDVRAQIGILTDKALDASVETVRRSNPTLTSSDGRTVIQALFALLIDVSDDPVTDPGQVAAIERAALWALMSEAPSH